jgi:tRNA pseudouridine55 synthase
MTQWNGVLRVDKPVGPTSHDAVALARRALRTRRVGHTGTLDPFASGLLLLCLGPATRLAEYLTALPKSYAATLRLGAATDTDDDTGALISSSDAWQDVSEAALRGVLAAQVGEIEQLPPVYSAKKVGGERMYAAARRGEAVERTPSRVTIHAIELTRFEPPEADFTVDCSSGTYIRAIARDAGAALGVGAHLTALRRTRVGAHDLQGAVPLDRLDDADAVAAAWVTPAEAVRHMPSAVVRGAELARLRNGGAVAVEEAVPAGEPVALLSEGGELLAIGERIGERVQPRKVLA